MSKRIVFVYEDFEMGGVELRYNQILKCLSDCTKYDLYVLSERGNGEFKPQIDNVIVFDGKKNLFKSYIEKIKPDIIYCIKSNLARYALYCKLTSSYRKYKIITALHNPIFMKGAGLFVNLKRFLGANIIYRIVDRVRTISDTMKQDLLSKTFISPDKIKVIENPLLDSNILLKAEEKVEFDFDYILAVGRLDYQKGFDILIEIFSKFISKFKDYRDIKLVILGDGPQKNFLLNKIKNLDLESKVILYGKTLNPYKYMKRAKCLVMTSRWEGFPSVLLESIFLQTPFIAFDCKFGPKEIADKIGAGHIVKFGDKEGFVETLYRVLKTDKRIDFKQIEEKISPYYIENACQKFLNFIEEELL